MRYAAVIALALFAAQAWALTVESTSLLILVGGKLEAGGVDVGGKNIGDIASLFSIPLSDASKASKNAGGDGFSFPNGAKMVIPTGKFAAYALKQAIEANRQNPFQCVPESVTVAQAILESASGTSNVAKQNNNLFGIKKYSGSSRCIKTSESAYCAYSSFTDSFADHNYFFYRSQRYSKAIACKSDFACFAREIKAAGYAEDPDYVSKLLQVIKSNGLSRYNSCA